MFSAWDKIKKHAEVVKFAVGLEEIQSIKKDTKQITGESSNNKSSSDNTGSVLVNHVYRMFTGKLLQDMRNGGLLSRSTVQYNLDLLIDMAHEMKSRIRIINEDSNEDIDERNIEQETDTFDPLCNRHFYYVTKLPLVIQSTVYVFGPRRRLQAIQNDAESTIESLIQKITEPCAVVIESPSVEGHQILQAVSNIKQSITDLYIHDLEIESTNEDATLKRIIADLNIMGSQPNQCDPFKWRNQLFQIDQHAKSIYITGEGCNLPQNVQTDLGRQISLCSDLQSLKISGQPFMAKEVAHNLGQNVGLKHLDISECHLRHQRVRPMGFPNIAPLPLMNPANFATPMSMLEAFGVHGSLFAGQSGFQGECDPNEACGLSEDLCSVLCEQLKSLVHLKQLNLSKNPLGTKGAHHLAESIRSWASVSALQYLSLSGCKMQECGYLLESLASCKEMVALDLSGNNLNDPSDGDKLAQSITSWKRESFLVKLNLNGCGIKDCTHLVEALGTCKLLLKLTLSNNQIGTEGCRNLARSIRSWGENSALQGLYINNCQLDPDGSGELLNALAACPQLITMDISGNAIGKGFQRLIPHSVFPRLIELEMNNTSLAELDVQVLGDIISSGGMPRLWSFALCGCQISSSAAAHLMRALSACKGLKTLYLSNNPIGGAFQHLCTSKYPNVGDFNGPEQLLGYQALRHLWLKETSLHSADIHALAALVTDGRMPDLNTIVIGWDKLANEASAIKENMMSKQLNSFLTALQKGTDEAMNEALTFLNLPDDKNVVTRDVDEYQHLFTDEPDEMLDALATILQNVREVVVWEADIDLNKERLKRLVNAEKNRRSNANIDES